METKEKDRAREQAAAQLDGILEMVGNLQEADEQNQEAAREAIQEDPLSIRVRGDWHDPGAMEDEAVEYEILLCTGGPAVRIIGDLDQYGQPKSAIIQYQDWGTPWTEYSMTSDQEDKILIYCQQFYYAE